MARFPFVPLIQGTLSNFHKISPASVFILFRGEAGPYSTRECGRNVDAHFQPRRRRCSSPLSLIEHLDANLLLIARRPRRVDQNLTGKSREKERKKASASLMNEKRKVTVRRASWCKKQFENEKDILTGKIKFSLGKILDS